LKAPFFCYSGSHNNQPVTLFIIHVALLTVLCVGLFRYASESM